MPRLSSTTTPTPAVYLLVQLREGPMPHIHYTSMPTPLPAVSRRTKLVLLKKGAHATLPFNQHTHADPSRLPTGTTSGGVNAKPSLH